MTPDAQRRLDGWIAEHVMDWCWDPGLAQEPDGRMHTAFLYPREWNTTLQNWPSVCGKQQAGAFDLVPRYTIEKAYAMEIVARMTAWDDTEVPRYWFQLTMTSNECWDVGFCRVNGRQEGASDDWHWHTVQTFDEVPLAICLAAQAALGDRRLTTQAQRPPRSW